MSKKNKSATAPAEKVDLTTSYLPPAKAKPGQPHRGAGQAQWFHPDELSPRRTREIAKWEMVIMPKLVRLATASLIRNKETGEVMAEDNTLPGLPEDIDVHDAAAILDLNTASAWAYLKSWTLKYPNGEPVELPETPDDLLDLDNVLYEALIDHAAKIVRDKVQLQVENPDPWGPGAFDPETAPHPGAEGATAPTSV